MDHYCHTDPPDDLERVLQVKRLAAAAFLHQARGDCKTLRELLAAEFRDDSTLAVEVAHSLAELIGVILKNDGVSPLKFATVLVSKVNTPAGEL